MQLPIMLSRNVLASATPGINKNLGRMSLSVLGTVWRLFSINTE